MLLLKLFCDTTTRSNQLSGGELAHRLWAHNFADTVDDWRTLDCCFQTGKLRLPPWHTVICAWQRCVEFPSHSGCCQPGLLQTGRSNRDAFSFEHELLAARIACGGLLSNPNASSFLPWNVSEIPRQWVRRCKSVVRPLKGWQKFSHFILCERIDTCVEKVSKFQGSTIYIYKCASNS